MSAQVDLVAGDRATRRVGDVTETVGLVLDPALYAALHRPSAGPQTAGGESGRGLLVCSPVYAEFMQNYGREVRLARRLAGSGVPVARFHYRGSGDSAGQPEDVTLESMVADGLEVAELLRSEAGVDGIDVLGTRLGGHVAAEIASRYTGSRLVIWEPVVEMRRYFDEIFRARRMVGVVANDTSVSSSAAMAEELEAAGRLDVVGYDLHRALLRSALAAPGLNPAGGRSGALLVQASRTEKVKRGLVSVADAIRDAGGHADIAVVPPGEGWWIHDYDEDTSPTAGQDAENRLMQTTIDWLAGVQAPGNPSDAGAAT
jgi:pimeloyl-ACP methyl ester carboxylesterase